MHHDPRTPHGYEYMRGITSAFLPQGTTGIIGGMFILLAIALASGLLQGVWLAAGVAGLIVLVPLMAWSIRREMKRDRRAKGRRQAPLPEDSELSEAERKQAQRQYSGPRNSRRRSDHDWWR